MRCIFCLIAAALVFSVFKAEGAPLGGADDVQVVSQSGQERQESQRRVVYRERSYFEFEDSLIRGDQPSPDGSSLFRKDRVPFRSSLNLHRSFMPELRESAKDAR